MNKPYICNYHVPINRSWESSAAALPNNPDDLEGFLRQAHTDAASLHETISRLDTELRTAKINQEIARKKVEALTSLNDEISVLRRNEGNATIEKIAQSIREPMELKESQEPKRRSAPACSKLRIFLAVVVILILVAAALLILVNTGGPLGQLVETQVTDSLRMLMNLRFR